MRKLILAALCLCVVSLSAQQVPPPDVLTPGAVSSTANTNYVLWANGQIASLWTQVTGLQSATASLSQDEANIGTLQTKLSADESTIQAQGVLIQQLQAQVAALTPTTPICPSQVLFTGLANGPITGIYQCLNFGSSGWWTIANQELAPAQDGQPQRSITFPRAVTITSFTFSTTTAGTTGIILTGSNGAQATATATGVNQDATFTPNFTAPVTSITITASPASGSAPDLRIRSISYQ